MEFLEGASYCYTCFICAINTRNSVSPCYRERGRIDKVGCHGLRIYWFSILLQALQRQRFPNQPCKKTRKDTKIDVLLDPKNPYLSFISCNIKYVNVKEHPTMFDVQTKIVDLRLNEDTGLEPSLEIVCEV